MSRFNAILLLVFTLGAGTPVGAQAPAAPTIPQDEIDPATGFARSTVVRPLRDAPPPPDLPPSREATRPPPPRGAPARPHIALILPTASDALGRLAEAVRLGFMAAAEVAGKDAPPVHVTAVENEAGALAAACRHAQSTGALIVVAGITRDGANSLPNGDCVRLPVLALNEIAGASVPNLYSVSLSLDQEARQAALSAVADGHKSVIVIHGPSQLALRVRDAFEREWSRAAGEVRRVAWSGNPEHAAALRERVLATPADAVFFALEPDDARAVRPYISATLPLYATSLSVNPRAEAVVNVDLQGLRYGEMPWFILPDHPAVMSYPPAPRNAAVDQERLYAFGIDAFRLALALLRREAARQPLDGVTGRLTLEPDNFFARTLSAAEVDGGRVIPLRGQ